MNCQAAINRLAAHLVKTFHPEIIQDDQVQAETVADITIQLLDRLKDAEDRANLYQNALIIALTILQENNLGEEYNKRIWKQRQQLMKRPRRQ